MDRSQFIADQALSACVLGANTDPRDRITQNVYDAASHVAQVNVAVGTADAATERKMMYTDNGLVQTLTDGENNRTTFVYDAFDRLSKTRYPVPAKGANESSTTDYEQFTYDANSNVTADRARSGDTITYGYDKLDRLMHKGGAVAGVDYTYDNLGRMLTAKFPTGGQGVTNTYDALSRLTSTNSDMGGTARTLTNSYDLAGRRTRLTWPDGFYVDYDYLQTGELSKVRENGATTGAGVLATFGYDDLGNRTSLTRGNGTSTSYGYDTLSRLTGMTVDLSGTTNDLTKTFTYNPASQIIQQTTSNDAYAFTGLANGSTATTTNGLNELATVGGAATAHDANGNLTSEPSVSRTFAYDTENKMTSATVGGTAASLSYDPLGRLWRVVKGGTDLRFLYDPASGADQMVAHYDSSGALQYRYVFTGNPDEPLLQYNSAGTRTWYSADERGSIIAGSSDSGSLAGILRYDEYGNPQSGNSGRFQYTGQMWLNETSSYFYRNRAYAQWLGRFPQTDPIGYAGGANLYAYVLNDPVNLVDPLGLCAIRVSGTAEEIVLTCDLGNGGPPGAPTTAGGSNDPGAGRGNRNDRDQKQEKVQCELALQQSGKIEYGGNTASAILLGGLQVSWGQWRNLVTGSWGNYRTVGGGLGIGIGVTRDYGQARSLADFVGYGETATISASYGPVGASYSVTQDAASNTVSQGGSLGYSTELPNVSLGKIGFAATGVAGETSISGCHALGM